jgi:hypothetical protein
VRSRLSRCCGAATEISPRREPWVFISNGTSPGRGGRNLDHPFDMNIVSVAPFGACPFRTFNHGLTRVATVCRASGAGAHWNGSAPRNATGLGATHQVSPILTGLRCLARGCAKRATPGLGLKTEATLKGLWPDGWSVTQPRWGWNRLGLVPREARSAQPWAMGLNPVGILCVLPLRSW